MSLIMKMSNVRSNKVLITYGILFRWPKLEWRLICDDLYSDENKKGLEHIVKIAIDYPM